MIVGISQRVDKVNRYDETRDALDHQWIRLLEKVGLVVVVIPNQISDAESYYHNLGLEGLILSGGNDPAMLENAINFSVERDKTEMSLIRTARESKHPILGVCRGMQYLCLQFGESLSRVDNHVAQRHILSVDAAFPYPEKHEVNSYHNWALTHLRKDSPWQVMAKTADQSIEAIKHRDEAIYGIMWHPERETEFCRHDINLIKKIFNHD